MWSFLKQPQWQTIYGGLALAAVFLLAALLVKPIGVSTQFVIFDGILLNSTTELIQPSAVNRSGVGSDNAYLNKSGGKYAADIEQPLNYDFIFVLAMILGGFLASITRNKTAANTQTPKTSTREYFRLFIGGFLVLFGARLADGCTSGHMMSGMMQTAVSGYGFAFAVFLIAVPTAMLLSTNKGEK